MTHQHEHEDEHEDEQAHAHAHAHDDDPLAVYAAEVARFRADKDAWFASSPSSPIPHEARHDFTGLPYFAVDPSFRFEDLALEPYTGEEPSAFQIPTSDGQLRPAHRAGTFTFELDGAPRRLTAYVLDGGHSHSLFLPFLDPTSGHETYGAGRYLDLESETDGTYIVDFNLGYHPSCVYDSTFSCPLTPAENRLTVRIEAGERLPEDQAEA